MPLDFPTSPANNDTYTFDNKTWRFTTGKGWKLVPNQIQGIQGTQGLQGTQGPVGNFQGTQGTQGLGNQGTLGAQGTQGTQGTQGLQGLQGTFGPATTPQNSQTTAYTLTSADNGKYIDITTGGVTVSTTTAMTAGQNVMIFNNSTSNQTITAGAGTTLRYCGTAATGNRTIAQYGLATILCIGTNTYAITGAGVT